jgi:translocation protein SEC63
MKLTKAYQALTDDEARRNWEKYGNPDGPGAMSFGIALPSWIVEKENSVWVLGLYALVFMVALPTVVGMWWYRSIRYTGDQVLLSTTEMYYHYFHKTPSMALKRVIMILAASLEFEKRHNGEIVERPTDNEEVPHLIKQFTNLGEKNRERPLCFTYSIKARALLHAHLHRTPLNPETLDKDRQYIVKKCPYLIQEMVNCVSHLVLLGYARRVQHVIHLETIENCMKLCPLIVQGMWEYKSPLLQLPHITEENLKYFTSKKRHIKSIQQVAQLKHEERRHMLRNLSDEQYEDVMKVIGKMPYIDFQVRSEVIDDENPTVYTAGAIVTVTVTLVRNYMSGLFGDESVTDKHEQQDASSLIKGEEEEEDIKKETVARKPVWQKQKKGKKGGKKSAKNQKFAGKTIASKKNDDKKSEDKMANATEAAHSKQEVSRKAAADTGEESEGSNEDADHSDDDDDQHSQGDKASLEDDDTEWEKFQAPLTKREKVLEGKSKRSHSVHCPLFPEDKQEYWWVYICDRKSRTILTSPYHVTALVEQEEVQLKFTAPRWPGVYTFTVCLRSDSYLGFDQMHDLKLDVKEAPEVPTEHPQWDMLDDEEEVPEGGGSDVSEFTTDEDVEDE